MASPDPVARIAALADECVKCGLCLTACPTYALDATETESPRGRIALAAAGTSGVVPAGFDLRLHLDHCLACMACERVCPVPVHYGSLLVETRATLPAAKARPRALLGVLSRPGLLRSMVWLARLSFARFWAPPLARVLLRQDSALRAAIGLLPILPRESGMDSSESKTVAARGTVALFGGCVQGVFERDAQDATELLLRAEGFEITRIDDTCCGALAAHTGDQSRAHELMARVQAAFERSGAEALITATPGCLGTLRAALPNTRVEEALGFISTHADDLKFKTSNMRVALHLPCTQVNVARNGDAVHKLIARIPGLQIDVLPTQAQCCGAAGSHMLEFPGRAAAYREKVLAMIPQPAPDILLTSNIGCRLHLAAGLREGAKQIAVEHPLALLGRQLFRSS